MDIVAELMVRVCSSFLVIPSHIVDLDDDEQPSRPGPTVPRTDVGADRLDRLTRGAARAAHDHTGGSDGGERDVQGDHDAGSWSCAAAATLAVGVRVADAVAGQAAPAGAQVAELVDFTDALTLAALPTQHLLVIEVTAASRVVVRLPQAEVGQGITTAVAQIVAEEIDARLADVDVVLEDARPELVFNQLTGGSTPSTPSTGRCGRRRRRRARLVTAAAWRWHAAAGDPAARTPPSWPPTGAPPPMASCRRQPRP